MVEFFFSLCLIIANRGKDTYLANNNHNEWKCTSGCRKTDDDDKRWNDQRNGWLVRPYICYTHPHRFYLLLFFVSLVFVVYKDFRPVSKYININQKMKHSGQSDRSNIKKNCILLKKFICFLIQNIKWIGLSSVKGVILRGERNICTWD